MVCHPRAPRDVKDCVIVKDLGLLMLRSMLRLKILRVQY